MDEVEMEDICEDEVTDVEYIDDIYSYFRKSETTGCAPSNYMEQQFDINERMRAILIDWLIEVHYKFELMEETLFLVVNLIDRFLSLQAVERKKLQLVGVTAVLLACKYEEVSVPVVEDLIIITDKAYSRKDVLDMLLQPSSLLSVPLTELRTGLKPVNGMLKYSEDELLECSKMIVTFHKNAGTGKLTGIYRKYSMSKFGYAAKAEPALFLLETRP